MSADLIESAEEEYQRAIRAAVRGLWQGVFTYDDFFETMIITIRRGLTKAWHEGAAEAGVRPDELSPREEAALEQNIIAQYGYLDGIAVFVEKQSRANGGKLAICLARAALWGNRYGEIKALALTMAMGDRKLQWILGATEKHCTTCAGLHMRVYRASTWQENGALPRTRRLECRGFMCLCDLVPTTDRITPGRFPRSLLVEHDHESGGTHTKGEIHG